MFTLGEIRIEFKNNTKQITLLSDSTLTSVKEQAASLFGIKNVNRIRFLYTDEEGDNITLSTMKELEDIAAKSGKVTLQFGGSCRKICTGEKTETTVTKPAKAGEEVDKKVEEKSNLKEKKREEGKSIKERRQAFKKSIVHTKLVRLGWKVAEEGRAKGCFLGCKLNGKLNLNAGRGAKGMWFLHETKKGDVLIAPLACPARHIRVGKCAKLVLNNGGAGPRARWNIVKNGDRVSVETLQHNDSVQLVSQFESEKLIGANTSFNKKNKPKFGPQLIKKSDPIGASVIATSFTVEVVDPTKALQKVVKQMKLQKKLRKEQCQKRRECFQKRLLKLQSTDEEPKKELKPWQKRRQEFRKLRQNIPPGLTPVVAPTGGL